MVLNFKYRLYPTKTESKFLDEHFFSYNQAYNYTINTRSQDLKNRDGFTKITDIYREVISNLKERKLTHNSGIVQQAILHADAEMKHFFRKRGGFPNFRQSAKITQSFEIKNQGIEISHEYFKIMRRKIKWKYHRELPAWPKKVIVKRESDGKFYVIFSVEVAKKEIKKTKVDCAIDMNVQNVAVAESTGKAYLIQIKKLAKYDKKYMKIQKKLSRRYEQKKKTKNTKKLQKKLNRIHKKVEYVKENFFHKVSIHLVKNFDRITAEDLSIKQMKESNIRLLRKLISEVSWGSLISKLAYKTEMYDKVFEQINPAYTSQRCNRCGYIDRKNRTSQAVFKCKKCGHKDNADLNAAKNILSYREWEEEQKALLERKALIASQSKSSSS